MKILITGGGGFLGSHIVKRLVELRHEVTNFSRKEYPNLKCVCGDLKNFDDISKAICGHEAVFHVASQVGMSGSWKSFYQTNVIGTRNVIEACKRHGVKKLIYTSTPSVAFGNKDLLGVDETTPYPKKYYSYYGKSKAMAERLVLDANSSDLLTVSLRPHLIFGPGDPNLIPRLVKAHRSKRLKIVGEGNNKADVLFVENAADAHIAAFNKLEPGSPLAGQAYFLGQGPVKLWDFTNRIMAIHNLPPVQSKIPFKVAYAVGALFESLIKTFRLYRWEPPMTRFIALQLAKSHYYDHSKAQRDLDFHPKVSIDEALQKICCDD